MGSSDSSGKWVQHHMALLCFHLVMPFIFYKLMGVSSFFRDSTSHDVLQVITLAVSFSSNNLMGCPALPVHATGQLFHS